MHRFLPQGKHVKKTLWSIARSPHSAIVPVLLVLVALVAATFPPLTRDAAAQSLFWERYDVTIDLNPDGTYLVTEDQVINFTEGSFSEGFAVIPLDRIEDIDNIQVSENGQPYREGNGTPGTYQATIIGGEVEILWWFEPAQNEMRQFTISYIVEGNLRVYGDREQIWWRAVDEDFAADIRNMTVTVNLPQPVPQDLLIADWEPEDIAFPADIEITGETQVVYTASDIEQGEAWEVRLEFPRMTTAAVPSWQVRDDERREREEELAPYKAAANAIMVGVGILLLVAGSIGIYVLWFTKGRDAPVALPIDLLREPPDDTPPAAVGTLIDERAHDHDIIAGIVALGEKGVIQIVEEEGKGALAAIGLGGRDFTFRRVNRELALSKHENAILNALFGSRDKDEVKLSTVKASFAARQDAIKSAVYDELAERGYFVENPQDVRRTYRGVGCGLLALSTIGGFFLFSALSTFAPLVIVPLIAAAILALVLIATSSAMPRKTEKGSESAQKWLAFRRYLAEIERYDNVADAKTIFNRYLPYAVAFELERGWVRKFASVDTPAPEWYGGDWEMGYPRGGRLPRGQRRGGDVVIIPGGGGWSGGPGRDGGGIDLPDAGDLQDMSDRGGRSLQGMSDGLFDLFNEAAKAFTSYNSSGSSRGRSGGFGGFSGGGRSFGGGGGGGSRGFR